AVGHEVMSGAEYIHPMVRINNDIKDKVMMNEAVDRVLDKTRKKNGRLHLMGLVSRNREHSDIRHLYSIMRRAVQKKVKEIFIHFFTDGRGTPPFSAVRFAEDLENKINEISNGAVTVKIATVGGRDITMNRSTDSWYKTIKTFRAIVEGKAKRTKNIFNALKKDYEQGITDQYVKIRVLGDYRGAENNDTFIHWNFRKDRAKMLMQLLTEKENTMKREMNDPNFKKIRYKKDLNYDTLDFLALVEYYKGIDCEVAYPDLKQKHSLGNILEKFGYHQYRISGVDKKHAVILLSGGSREKPFPHEERIVVPLPKEMEQYKIQYEEKKGEPGFKMDPYEKYPEIELPRLTEKVIEILENSPSKSFLIVNLSNPDMVGHTASMDAGIKAARAIDRAMEKVYNSAVKCGAYLFITADHGNMEESETEDGLASTFHTENPVPFVITGRNDIELKQGGCLKDVAPTVLYVMEPDSIDIIENEFKGNILVKHAKKKSAFFN
ncbi:MAG: hypothetical protein ACOC5R_03030, partial [Elusimicrobiota bacterium]